MEEYSDGLSVSILMLSWNRLPALQACLWSLRDLWHRNMDTIEMLILDNGSKRPQVDWLRRYQEQHSLMVQLHLSGDNKGVAGGRDFLIQRAHGDIIVILDGDVVISSHTWLDRLVEPLQNSSVGLCGPAGNMIRPDWRGFTPLPENKSGPADVVSGYCQAFRREILSEGVRLDMAYNPYWHEDSDFCLQLRARGYTIWHTGDVGVMHMYAGSGDDGRSDEKMLYMAGKYRGKGLIAAEQDRSSVGH